jgi:hypothetical protein
VAANCTERKLKAYITQTDYKNRPQAICPSEHYVPKGEEGASEFRYIINNVAKINVSRG